MSRRSKKRRAEEQAQQEELLAPDAFEQQGATWTRVFEQNFAIVLGVLVIFLVGIVAFEMTTSSNAQAASDETAKLMEGVEAYESAVRFAVFTTTTAEAYEAKYEEAHQEFAPALSLNAGAPARELGLLYDADLQRKAGRYEAAIKDYDEYLAGAKPDDPLRFLAFEGKGYAWEATSDLDKALEAFQSLAGIPEYNDFGYKHVARVLLKQGDVTGAKEALQSIIDRDTPSVFKQFAESQLEKLE